MALSLGKAEGSAILLLSGTFSNTAAFGAGDRSASLVIDDPDVVPEGVFLARYDENLELRSAVLLVEGPEVSVDDIGFLDDGRITLAGTMCESFSLASVGGPSLDAGDVDPLYHHGDGFMCVLDEVAP